MIDTRTCIFTSPVPMALRVSSKDFIWDGRDRICGWLMLICIITRSSFPSRKQKLRRRIPKSLLGQGSNCTTSTPFDPLSPPKFLPDCQIYARGSFLSHPSKRPIMPNPYAHERFHVTQVKDDMSGILSAPVGVDGVPPWMLPSNQLMMPQELP